MQVPEALPIIGLFTGGAILAKGEAIPIGGKVIGEMIPPIAEAIPITGEVILSCGNVI